MTAASGELVVLSVGGMLFHTTRTSLKQRAGTMLTAMFSGEYSATLLCDAEGRPFIDRDPKHFPAVLAFMRDGTAVVPSSPDARRELRAEAAFFGLEPLMAEIDAAEKKHATQEAARDAKLLGEAQLVQERSEIADIANNNLVTAKAEAEAAIQALQAIKAELAAAQQEGAAADRELGAGAELAPGVRLAAQQRLHAACLRWHQAKEKCFAADMVVAAAEQKQLEWHARKMSALQLAAPGPLPPLRMSIPPVPAHTVPRRPPPTDFQAWLEEQQQGRQQGRPHRIGAFDDLFGFGFAEDDDPAGGFPPGLGGDRLPPDWMRRGFRRARPAPPAPRAGRLPPKLAAGMAGQFAAPPAPAPGGLPYQPGADGFQMLRRQPRPPAEAAAEQQQELRQEQQPEEQDQEDELRDVPRAQPGIRLGLRGADPPAVAAGVLGQQQAAAVAVAVQERLVGAEPPVPADAQQQPPMQVAPVVGRQEPARQPRQAAPAPAAVLPGPQTRQAASRAAAKPAAGPQHQVGAGKGARPAAAAKHAHRTAPGHQAAGTAAAAPGQAAVGAARPAEQHGAEQVDPAPVLPLQPLAVARSEQRGEPADMALAFGGLQHQLDLMAHRKPAAGGIEAAVAGRDQQENAPRRGAAPPLGAQPWQPPGGRWRARDQWRGEEPAEAVRGSPLQQKAAGGEAYGNADWQRNAGEGRRLVGQLAAPREAEVALVAGPAGQQQSAERPQRVLRQELGGGMMMHRLRERFMGGGVPPAPPALP